MTAPVVRILPFTHLAREGRMTATIGRRVFRPVVSKNSIQSDSRGQGPGGCCLTP
jgi:hypothetical protein